MIAGLAARYCVRQDARGFIEIWGLVLVLAAAASAILVSARRKAADGRYRRVAYVCAGILACFIVLSGGFALAIFRWCYESAAASLGMVDLSSPTAGLDWKICMSMHAVETLREWIVLVVSCILAAGLIVLGIVRFKRLMSRALALAGAAAALLFVAVVGFFMLFGFGWCQSSRLF